MRIGLSLVGLLTVVFVVGRLAGLSLAGGGGGGQGAQATPASAAAVAADTVQRAMQQAAEARACDAAGR